MLSFNDRRISKNVTIYPNPVAEKLTVEIGYNSGEGQIQLIDLTGRLQSTICIGRCQKKAEIDVSCLKPGIYLLKVLEGEKVVANDKVVVGYMK
jgi:hypothetical protein